MSCLSPTESELEAIRKRMGSQEINENIITLLRGGFVIKTQIGNIQVGMPPETVKDSMNLGINMPNVFIVPRVRYDKKSFLNVAEFEFPAYFNFFITRKRIRILCTQETKLLLEIVFQETLLGPKDFANFEKEFDDSVPKNFIPDMKKELSYFAVNPFTKEKLTVETLLDIIVFDENNQYTIDNKVRIINNLKDDTFEFYDIEKSQFIARTPQTVILNPSNYYCSKLFKEEKIKLIQAGSDKNIKGSESESAPLGFTPPFFGVTVLGASHGFDCHGSTSGYIIWVNQRGIMVDPPPFSGTSLRDFGIPPNIIDKIIITHCHADHDAGSFQKILMAHQVEIVTSPTIMGSFLRKYSAMTGFSIKQMKSFFVFRPVTMGSPVNIAGGEFRFFYTFHSIPTIGFEICFCGKSIYFSADTFYNPPALKDIYLKGVFTKQRYEALVDVNWLSYDLILHEAGVPPIHTPTKVLEELPPAIKDKLYLVHIAAKDIPTGTGLKAAIPG